jgi:hypothetical protein
MGGRARSVGMRWCSTATIPYWRSARRWSGRVLRWATASDTNGRGCAPTAAAIIESLSELYDARIGATKNGNDDVDDRLNAGRELRHASSSSAALRPILSDGLFVATGISPLHVPANRIAKSVDGSLRAPSAMRLMQSASYQPHRRAVSDGFSAEAADTCGTSRPRHRCFLDISS